MSALAPVYAALQNVARRDRPLVILGLGSLLTALASQVSMWIDPRQLLGASVWLKPWKFGVSIAVVSFTLALLLQAIDVPARARRRAVLALSSLLWVELGIITWQAARGRMSHFNTSSIQDGVLFYIMGAAITIATAIFAYLGVRAFRTHYRDEAIGWGIRLGLVILVLGSLIGFLMSRPTSEQLESMRGGAMPPVTGAHSVGVSDGGPGMPVTRWSTEGGDLRVPHFAGLHALQVLPLVGLWLGRRRSLGAVRAARLTIVASGGYFGAAAITLSQALRGQPLLAPDAITWALVAGLVAGVTLAAWIAYRLPERRLVSTAAIG